MFECNVGVRQGCVLSPFLFSVLINELADKIEYSCYPGIQLHPNFIQHFLFLFADDVVHINNKVTCLQRRIYKLYENCNKHNLSVNLLDKSKSVVYKNGGVL